MLAIGIASGWLASALWIGAHLVWVRLRPGGHRLKSMLAGYAASLPLPLLVCLWLRGGSGADAPALAHLHAYLWHLLLFFAYAEFYYMVERSVTLRFLAEILQRPGGQAALDGLRADYNVEHMIRRRLALLEENGFIEQREGRWRLKPKGRRMAAAMRVSAWIYQSAAQSDRL